jgi:hypothetical protein
MAGAIIQLVAKGVQDFFLTQNPEITYFKIVYRRHTNFSLEAIPQHFIHKPDFGKKVSCIIANNGDLMGKTHLVVTLPKIKALFLEDNTIDEKIKFAWVKKIGFALIKSIEIELGGQTIDKQYGEWLNIIYELFIKKDNNGYDKMIGNTYEATSFTQTKDKITLFIPLQFWFCKYPSLAIPILCLYHSEIKINLELNDLDKCYILSPTNYFEVEDDIVSFKPFEYIEQTINNETASGLFSNFDPITKRIYYNKISRNNFLALPDDDGQTYTIEDIMKTYPQYLIKSRTNDTFCIPKIGSTSKLYQIPNYNDITLQECYLLVNYIYLDSEERNRFVQSKNEYLIEQVHIFNTQLIQASNFSAKIDSINPIKFIVWFVQQQYFTDSNVNDHFNYTDDYLYTYDYNTKKHVLNGNNLIKYQNIQYNGYDRISRRSTNYFNHLQPYQHFITSPNEGINVYSYSLDPTKFQPSGSCNYSYIGLTEIKLNLNYIINDKNTAIFKGYALGHNILRIIDGLGGLVFIK